jgi:hypothetical protein
LALKKNTMISIRKRPHAPRGVVARGLFPGRVLARSVAAFLLAVAAHSPATLEGRCGHQRDAR